MSDPSGPVDLGFLPELLGYRLRRAQVAAFQDFHHSMASLGLRPAQFSVLVLIEQNAGLRSSQIADALGIKRTNLVPLLDELEGKDLIERRRDPDDGRAFRLRLTKEGRALLDAAKRRVRAHERRLAKRLEPGGPDQLLRLLGQLVEGA